MKRLLYFWAIAAFAIFIEGLSIQNSKLNVNQIEENKAPEAADEIINYRLPKNLKPTNYDVYSQPDFETDNFTGQVLITIDVLEDTKQIVMHALNLEFKSIYVISLGDENLLVENYVLDNVREFRIVNMAETLRANTTIRFGSLFSGTMSDKIRGLYTSSYWTPENEKRTIATTDFEPTNARQAFPCFDEPAMKATFDFVLAFPNERDLHAISNMDILQEKPQGAFTEVYFRKSVAMSTYLACFIISDMVFNSKSVNVNGIGENFDIRVFATKHQLHKVDFALDVAVAAIEYFVDYYQVAYPLPKLDLASVPDFPSNAMENWGLITFRESALMFDANSSSTYNKQRVAVVVTHELAHMWFGNLVTMNWWNDVWLNEGFASYMQYKGVDEIFKDWGMSDQFLIDTLHGVLQFDARTASHPIIQTVESPAQITEIFDTISYEKGASIIRMLEHTVGAENFAKGVTNYLRKFQYKNAVTDDFIAELENLELDFNVKHFMRTWTVQMGFPIIEVNRTSPAAFTIKQKRFFANIEDYNELHNDSEFNYTWNIPLTYISDFDINTVERLWFRNHEHAVGLPVPIETKWLKFNTHQVGYYRVNYDVATWRAIIKNLQTKPASFDISDRAHLLNDIFAIADASQLSYDIAMEITKYLNKEQDFVPWHVAASKLQALQGSLMKREAYVNYLKYARNLISGIYNTVGWKVAVDNHTKNRLRVTVLTTACALGMPECLTEAARQFNIWLSEPGTKPAPDLREIVYYYGMQQIGDEDIWQLVWQRFIDEKDASEKNKLMYGLGGIKVPWLLHSFISQGMYERFVRRQDYLTLLQDVAKNPVGESIVWEFIRDKWALIVKKFGLNDRYLGRMIPAITARFDTLTKLEEIQEFFSKYPEAGAGVLARQQAIESTKYNIKWLQQNEQTLGEWLIKETKNL